MAHKHHQPPQTQRKQPGIESKMRPKPKSENKELQGCNRLKNKVAIITGGDSGIGRAIAVAYAKEGAKVVFTFLNERVDAKETVKLINQYTPYCSAIAGDIRDEKFCKKLIKSTVKKFGRLDILVNNAGVQFPKKSILDISKSQLEYTFQVNIFSMFYLTKAALPYLKAGSSIINTTSITAYKGNKQLIDYSATKGAIVTFTRSLSASLMKKKIRVNAVAPGPIWTPLIPATFSAEKVAEFGEQVPMKRAGQPWEVASCYVFLASEESAYISGQVLHPNGGFIING